MLRKLWHEDRALVLLLMAALALAVAFGLLLVSIRNLEPALATRDLSLFGSELFVSMLQTRQSAFMITTLLAGMLGAYLRVISNLGDVTAGAVRPSEFAVRFAASLMIGGFASIVAGVLLPLIVFGTFEQQQSGSSWTLVAAGGLIGYASSSILLRGDSAIVRLIAGFETRLDSSSISTSVKNTIIEALSPPRPVNYEGQIALDVVESNGESAIKRVSGKSNVVVLVKGRPYELLLQFGKSSPDSAIGTSGVGVAISVTGGDVSNTVPFRVFIDFGLPGIAPQERVLVVPAYDNSETERVGFTVPKEPGAGDHETEEFGAPKVRPEICVSVYQHGSYLDSLIVQIDTCNDAASIES